MNVKAGFAAFPSDECGVAAVEMGLVAPFLIGGFLLMVDVGIAVGERMELDRHVRAGVQAVMSQINEPDEIKQLILASADGATDVTVAVDKTCSCGGAATECTSWCSAQEPPSVIINISAVKPHSGLILPKFTLKSRTHVQLR